MPFFSQGHYWRDFMFTKWCLMFLYTCTCMLCFTCSGLILLILHGWVYRWVLKFLLLLTVDSLIKWRQPCTVDVMLKSSYLLTCLLAKNSHWSCCLLEKWKYNVMATHSWWWMCACLHVSVLCVVCKCVCNRTFTPWSAWLANVIDGASTVCQT